MFCTALLWIFRAQLTQISWFKNLSDPTIAILASVVLFAFPSGESDKTEPLLVWQDTKKLPWDILLLFGGGISLAKGMEVTDIVGLVGNWISSGSIEHPFLIILIICGLAVFLTEVMSNVALVSVFVPVSFVVAQNLGLSELQLAIPLTIGSTVLLCSLYLPHPTL